MALGTMMRPPERKPTWHVVLGAVLVVPAAILLLTSYVVPALWTLRRSFETTSFLRQGGSGGRGNYSAAFDEGIVAATGHALSYVLVPLVVALIVAPVLARCAHAAGPATRRLTRVLLAFPLAVYAPAAVAAAWSAEDGPDHGWALTSARQAYWIASVGLVAAIGVTVQLAAMRRRDSARSPGPAMGVASGVLAAAVLAVGLRSFAFPLAFGGSPDGGSPDGGSPNGDTPNGDRRDAAVGTPVLRLYELTVVERDLGPAAAITTLLMVGLAILGIVVTIIAVNSRLRLEIDPGGGNPSPRRAPAVVATAILLLVVLTIFGYGVSPVVGGVLDGRTGGVGDPGEVLFNTFVPPLFTSVVGVVVAALAGFGIGGLRPLGRYSELLLLPFGVFLFVGALPAALRAFAGGRTANQLDSWVGLIPPVWLSIPALLLFTLLFRGQAERYALDRQVGGAPRFLGTLLFPALPMLPIAIGVTWLVQAQDPLWPSMSGAGGYDTGPVATVGTGLAADALPYGLVLPPLWVFGVLLAAIAAQLLYLDRLALRVGRPERDGGPRT